MIKQDTFQAVSSEGNGGVEDGSALSLSGVGWPGGGGVGSETEGAARAKAETAWRLEGTEVHVGGTWT